MTAIFVPIATQAAVDAAAAEAAAGSVALGVAAAPVVAIVAAGAAVDYTLLRNKAWTGFWNDVGGNVVDWYHDASDFLFGGGGVSLQTVVGMVQLSLHGANRLSRELFTEASVAVHAQTRVLAHYIDALRKEAFKIEHDALNVTKVLSGAIHAAIATAEAYTDRGLARLLRDVRGIELGLAAAIEAWAIDNIAHPLLREIARAEAKIDGLVADLGTIIDRRVGHLLDARLATVVASIAGLSTIVAELAIEMEECAQPMCEVVGPKTDWFKLLKRFAPAAFLAMLAEIAAENPQALESGAEDVARLLGPVLSAWVEEWALGNASSFPAQPKEVGGAIGHVPLIP